MKVGNYPDMSFQYIHTNNLITWIKQSGNISHPLTQFETLANSIKK